MKKLTTVFLLLIVLVACKPNTQITDNASTLSYLSQLNTTHLIHPDSIRHYIRTGYLPASGQTVWDSVLTAHYMGSNDFLWLRPDGRQQMDTLLHWLDQSYRHGLDDELFFNSRIKEEVRKLKSLTFAEGETINHSFATLEYLLTKAYMHYVCGMQYGFVKPHLLFNNMEVDDDIKYANVLVNGKRKMKTLYQIPLKECTRTYADSVFSCLKTRKADVVLRDIQPTSLFYTKMQEEIDKYMPLVDRKFEPIPDMGDALVKEGESHAVVPLIARRLLISGELDSQWADTTSLVLTSDVLQAVNKFRIANRLPEDTSIGAFTVRFLNNPMTYYVERLKANLERARWQYASEKGKKYVFVNTAAFMLKAVNEEIDSIVEMRICCGTARNKTPLLASKIHYIELNPYWNVPQNIIKKEIIPAFRRDSAYFTKHRMKVYDSTGNLVNPHEINWSTYARGVPFSVKQDNREGNSLGRIIFRFPNSFAVYLHDTPVRGAFLRTNRAVSHGCVRLERALDFAFFLLEKPNPVLQDRIRVAMSLPAKSDEGKKVVSKEGYKDLEHYNLKEHVPLYLDYQTMYLSADNALSYCEDTYKYDKVLLTALEQLNRQYAENKR